ncbi:14 kDa subunit of cytochrome bd ubiquinol oxidase [Auricularia subglabra TFB-10046 SS5]|nr:14 kDa subunit of cytochrome bd ubiquinol oxidase [Auricularia subglabra TFB-10046 SS5]
MVVGFSLAPWIMKRPGLLRALKPISGWYVQQAGWRKVGLLYDDLIVEENDTVQKALSRLPKQAIYDRSFRIRRAQQQDVLHSDLPESQWTKPEDDVPYLTPYIEQVVKEENERVELDNLIVRRLPPGAAH